MTGVVVCAILGLTFIYLCVCLDTHLAIAAETALNFFPGAAVRTNTSPQLQVSQPAESDASTAAAAAPASGRRDSCRSSQRSRVTADGTCTLFVEDYKVPLSDGSGFLPMDRECRRETFSKGSQKGAVLLIPGFASNRQMFHLGGGVGKSGPSFSEFLAQREYDVFAIDLRGTTESLALGGKRAAGMREYVEVDIPSAIQMIKRLGGYKQVYLIGHSMGGALSCAVAGICPEDVAGVIHVSHSTRFASGF
ncbi:Alpha/Beta hydrolase protein [Geranomyces variabilis]|nr:Alpha/Beta hydrolase protein [Geranomyces variabilis]